MSPPGRPEELAGKVRAVAAPNEFRISVEVDDADPRRAQQIANAAAYSWVEKVRAEAASRPNQEKQDIYLEVSLDCLRPGC